MPMSVMANFFRTRVPLYVLEIARKTILQGTCSLAGLRVCWSAETQKSVPSHMHMLEPKFLVSSTGLTNSWPLRMHAMETWKFGSQCAHACRNAALPDFGPPTCTKASWPACVCARNTEEEPARLRGMALRAIGSPPPAYVNTFIIMA